MQMLIMADMLEIFTIFRDSLIHPFSLKAMSILRTVGRRCCLKGHYRQIHGNKKNLSYLISAQEI